jgi:hypothetical protein
VTIESSGVVIAAVLRIGVHCGIEVVPAFTSNMVPGGPEVQAGIDLALVAHVAEFVTNVTYSPQAEDCKLEVVQIYNLALGAIAGASMEANVPILGVTSQTWGPVIGTSTLIFTTTMAQLCTTSAEPRTAGSDLGVAAQNREDFTTTILTSEVTTSGVSCVISSEFNCPASMQRTTKTTYTTYHTTAAAPGATPTFPATMVDSVQSRKPFGTRAQTIRAMSGSPTAYTAPPIPSEQAPTRPETQSKSGGAKSNGKQVGIGVGVGLGIPLIIAIACAIL